MYSKMPKYNPETSQTNARYYKPKPWYLNEMSYTFSSLFQQRVSSNLSQTNATIKAVRNSVAYTSN